MRRRAGKGVLLEATRESYEYNDHPGSAQECALLKGQGSWVAVPREQGRRRQNIYKVGYESMDIYPVSSNVFMTA